MRAYLVVFCCVALLQLSLADSDDEPNKVEYRSGETSIIILNCTLRVEAVNWKRNHTIIQEKETLKFTHDKDTGIFMLTNTKPKVGDIGLYTCEEAPSGQTQEFEVIMAAHVAKLATSSNVVEGEKLRVACAVFGYPTPRVQWKRKDDDEEEAPWVSVTDDGHITITNSDDGIENAILIINEVKNEDRDEYMCVGINQYGTHNSTTLIRVIDKYAALWPFLGICVEVIVLCAVIFIFEKRRGKKQFDEAENEQNNSKHVPTNKDSEVRNRK